MSAAYALQIRIRKSSACIIKLTEVVKLDFNLINRLYEFVVK